MKSLIVFLILILNTSVALAQSNRVNVFTCKVYSGAYEQRQLVEEKQVIVPVVRGQSETPRTTTELRLNMDQGVSCVGVQGVVFGDTLVIPRMRLEFPNGYVVESETTLTLQGQTPMSCLCENGVKYLED